jgi:hypothetical protein
MTVVETQGFLRDSAGRMTERERFELVTYLALNPDAGDLMPDTGGIRKIRWAIQGRGKRGGVRVIYYFHSPAMPLFLLNVFAKNEKANLTPAERRDLKAAIPLLIGGYRKGTK